MYWLASVAILLVVLSTERVLAQAQSVSEENAQIEKDNNCKCVLYYQCSNNTVDVYGGIFKLRASIPIPCKSPGNVTNNMICCKLDDSSTTQKPTDRSPAEEITFPTTRKNSSCGDTKVYVRPRVSNLADDLAPVDGEFPWIAAIFNKTQSGAYQFHCGGTLIHPKVVLTANHCVYKKKPNDFVVGANGRIDLPTDDRERRHISEIIGHPRYAHTGRLFFDAALLILESPFSVDGTMNTLCLPSADYNLEGKMCLVAGWGGDRSGPGRDILKRVEVPFVNRNKCTNDLKNTNLGKNFVLHRSFMCAGGEEGRDACIGDGGSPLMCELPTDSSTSRYFQAGIVSWGIGCGRANVPGVYVDVDRISEWIENVLQDRNLSV